MKRLRKLSLLLAVALLASLPLSAQNTTVTGNLRSILGTGSVASKGTIKYTLMNYTGTPRTSFGPIAELQKEIPMQTDGSFSIVMTDNAFIQPANTYYLVEFYSNGVFQSSTNCTITGTSYNQNSFTNCTTLNPGKPLLTALPFPTSTALGGILSHNCSPNVVGAINGDGTVTCVAGGGGGGSGITQSTLAAATAANVNNSFYWITDSRRGLYTTQNNYTYPISHGLNILNFGAGGDGGWYPQSSCTNGSAVISNVNNLTGRLPAVGDLFVAKGCGASGADLQCTLSAASGVAFGSVTCGGGVTALTTNAVASVRWSKVSIDDTPALVAAINQCIAQKGCTILFPQGTFFISNIVFPRYSVGGGSISIHGSGRSSTWIIGTGADHTALFQAPSPSGGDVSVPIEIDSVGIQNVDYKHANQIAFQALSGQEHKFTNNFVTNVYEMINFQNTWINLIGWNRCYAVTSHCIEFGNGVVGNDTVNATRTVFNELAIWGDGGDTTSHAYYVHSASASYENTFAFNSTEDDNAPIGEPIDVNDNQSQYIFEYQETVAPASGYYGIFRGAAEQVRMHGINCIRVTGSINLFGSASSSCPGQTYAIKDEGSVNAYGSFTIGQFSNVSNVSSVNAVNIYGLDAIIGLGALKVYSPSIGSVNDWGQGRVDIGSSPFTTVGAVGTGNPSIPNSTFGANAVVPYGTRVIVNTPTPGYPWGYSFYFCSHSPTCATNPLVSSDWWHFGETETRVRTEGASYAPNTQTWQPGDWFWNTSPGTNFTLGWMTVVGGTPGTGLPVKIVQTANATGCATAASVGATCPTTVTWPIAFANTSYKWVCGGALITSGVPLNGGTSAQAAASVTFQTVAATAATAQFTNINCAAWHD